MATSTQSVLALHKPAAWFQEFLKEELAPYPGRAENVAHMIIAATLVMVICMTFRVRYAYQGAVYALLISRENLRVTLQSAATMLLVTAIAAAYLLTSAWFVISVPMLHFLWIIVSFFAAFYAFSTITNYGAAAIFAFTVALGVPLWDRHLSAETGVEDTLRVVLASLIGVAVTAAVELAFARAKPGDDIVLPIAERLAAVESLLARYAERGPVDHETEKKVIGLSMRGTSRLRRVLRHSDYSLHYRSQMSGVVALVGGLVDIAATLTQLPFAPSGADHKQFRNLAATVASIRTDLMNRRIPGSIQFHPDDEPSQAVPLLLEMEKIVTLIPQAFAGSRSIDEYLAASDDIPGLRLVVPDALTNPEHLRFALKGCFAASLCYIIYNSVAWPGISTAVTTCLLTGLSTIGASRQKGILRFAGALVGGFLLSMGSQVFILPYLDSIVGFTVLFIFVTAFSSWFMTSSPRLSYFGFQAALAFYLINLQGFAMERSLSIARDRVVGILLGLFMMSLVFDQLWGGRAAVEMKRTFISHLRLLAQFAKEPLSKDLKVAVARSYSLRETINSNSDQVRSLADAVLFEFSSSRQQDLALRDRIRQWQPQLRALFLTRSVLWKYRVQLPGFELPKPVATAQQEFDDCLAKVLDGMADRMEGKASEGDANFRSSIESLDRTIQSYYPGMSNEMVTAQFGAFLSLSHRIESLTLSLDNEIQRKI
jgi:multidrug resistance protein MdtO